MKRSGCEAHALHMNSESIMKHVSIVLAALLTPLLIGAGTAAADSWKDESGKGFDKRRSNEDGQYGRGERERRRTGEIPRGHQPSVGECRMWYSGVPAGQQPPPYRC